MGQKLLEHKHLIIRAEIQKPPVNCAEIKQWLKDLVDTINMKILMGPYAVYSDMVGNQGLTAVTIIETSHIALHVWDEVSPALMQLDVYTCSELNIDDVLIAIQEFQPTKVEYKFIDREHELTLITERKHKWERSVAAHPTTLRESVVTFLTRLSSFVAKQMGSLRNITKS